MCAQIVCLSVRIEILILCNFVNWFFNDINNVSIGSVQTCQCIRGSVKLAFENKFTSSNYFKIDLMGSFLFLQNELVNLLKRPEM